MPSAIGPDRGSERVEHDGGPETEPERVPSGDSAPKGPAEGTK